MPDPPLHTPESPSSARASAVPDPIRVPDDPTVPDPPLLTPESPSSARANEVPDPNQVPDDSTVPDPPLPTPESPSSARAGGDRVLTIGHKRGWVVSTTFSKTLSTQVLTVVVLRVFSAKQLVLCTN